MDLWTDKYKPSDLSGVVGNGKGMQELKEFLSSGGRGKALLLHGPPGIGKSLSVELAAKELGLDVLEINASDERKKDAIESYSSASRTRTLFSKGRVILIEEVDGLAAGDRGGTQAIARLIKGSVFPVVLIANDPWIPKLRSLRSSCKLLKFNKIPSPSVEKFLRGVCKMEGVSVDGSALKSLARFSEGDLRTAVIDLQSACSTKSLEDKDLEIIGFRERGFSVHNILPTLMRSGRIGASRKVVHESDKDPDELLWWIENNLHLEFSGDSLAKALDTLAQADMYRALVMRQQNWGFKGYMVDLMVGVSVFNTGSGGYVAYKSPDKFIALARSRQRRAEVDELCERLGKELHCSKKVVRREFLPFLKIMLRSGADLELEEEDAKVVRN